MAWWCSGLNGWPAGSTTTRPLSVATFSSWRLVSSRPSRRGLPSPVPAAARPASRLSSTGSSSPSSFSLAKRRACSMSRATRRRWFSRSARSRRESMRSCSISLRRASISPRSWASMPASASCGWVDWVSFSVIANRLRGGAPGRPSTPQWGPARVDSRLRRAAGALQRRAEHVGGRLDHRDDPVVGHARGSDHPQHAQYLAAAAVGGGNQRDPVQRGQAGLLADEDAYARGALGTLEQLQDLPLAG